MTLKQVHKREIIRLCSLQEFAAARDYLEGLKPQYSGADARTRCDYYCNLARIYVRLSDFDRADSNFDLALGANPHNHATRLRYVDSLIQRGNFHNAEKLLLEMMDGEHAITLDQHGHTIELNKLMGKFFKLTGDYAAAVECYEQILPYIRTADAPYKDYEFCQGAMNNPTMHRLSGLINFVTHLRTTRKAELQKISRQQAITFLTNRLAEDASPHHQSTYHALLARCYFDAKDYVHAGEHAEAAYSLASHNPYANGVCIQYDLVNGDILSARRTFERAAAAIYTDPGLSVSLARIFLLAGDNQTSEKIARKVLESDGISPSLTESAWVIATSARGRRRYAQADAFQPR